MDTGAGQRTRGRGKTGSGSTLIKYGFLAGLMLVCFLAGRASLGDILFWKGYDAAMNHVSSTIKAKAVRQDSFYVADLGIRFTPKGNNILGISYVRNTAVDTADAVHVATAGR